MPHNLNSVDLSISTIILFIIILSIPLIFLGYLLYAMILLTPYLLIPIFALYAVAAYLLLILYSNFEPQNNKILRKYSFLDDKFVRCSTFVLMAFSLILLCGLAQIAVFDIWVNHDYVSQENRYQDIYDDAIKTKSELDAIWDVAEEASKRESIYDSNKPAPSRILLYGASPTVPAISAMNTLFFCENWDEFFGKLSLIQGGGACLEYASSLQEIVRDVTGMNTRVVKFEGHDHAICEVNVDGKWWIYDNIWTTQGTRIEASQYRQFLQYSVDENKAYLAQCIADLEDLETGESLLKEHGFDQFSLTIQVFENISSEQKDDLSPIEGTQIEIFTAINFNDPLVKLQKTKEDGKSTFNLNSEKAYTIISKKGNRVNITEITPPYSVDEEMVVYLKNYG